MEPSHPIGEVYQAVLDYCEAARERARPTRTRFRECSRCCDEGHCATPGKNAGAHASGEGLALLCATAPPLDASRHQPPPGLDVRLRSGVLEMLGCAVGWNVLLNPVCTRAGNLPIPKFHGIGVRIEDTMFLVNADGMPESEDITNHCRCQRRWIASAQGAHKRISLNASGLTSQPGREPLQHSVVLGIGLRAFVVAMLRFSSTVISFLG